MLTIRISRCISARGCAGSGLIHEAQDYWKSCTFEQRSVLGYAVYGY